jgi:molybdopterin synthase catalytic subunit
MRVRVLAFAVLRERLGFAERWLEVEEGTTAAGAAARVLGEAPGRGIALAVNQGYAGPDTVLADGDELALLPPVSGGGPSLRVQPEPIEVGALLDEVQDPGSGAVLLFLGVAREVEGERLVQLEYEAYGDMAERFFRDLAGEIRRDHGVDRLAIVHRLGPVAVGEASLVVALSSPHREAGFAALRAAVEAIKARAPVWKKEVTERGGRWVAAERMEGG